MDDILNTTRMLIKIILGIIKAIWKVCVLFVKLGFGWLLLGVIIDFTYNSTGIGLHYKPKEELNMTVRMATRLLMWLLHTMISYSRIECKKDIFTLKKDVAGFGSVFFMRQRS